MQLRVQFPSGQPPFGSIGSISFADLRNEAAPPDRLTNDQSLNGALTASENSITEERENSNTKTENITERIAALAGYNLRTTSPGDVSDFSISEKRGNRNT